MFNQLLNSFWDLFKYKLTKLKTNKQKLKPGADGVYQHMYNILRQNYPHDFIAPYYHIEVNGYTVKFVHGHLDNDENKSVPPSVLKFLRDWDYDIKIHRAWDKQQRFIRQIEITDYSKFV